jgi:hypothetical protein
MPTLGNLTFMLPAYYVVRGWRLTEDEDFVYLWERGNNTPRVFSAQRATIESIVAEIDTITEGK